MQVLRGDMVQFDPETNERLMRQSTYEWPHAFVRMHTDSRDVLSRYGSNHIHAAPGDHVEALRAFCRLADVDYDGFGDAR